MSAPGHERLLILDFGSQYTQLIARRVREQHVYCEIHPFSMTASEVAAFTPRGIILSGGPASLTSAQSPRLDPAILDLGLPILGVCYGLQMISELKGGQVSKALKREYGRAELAVDTGSPLFAGLPGEPFTVWMSHGDKVETLAPGFRTIAHTDSAPYAAIADESGRLFGVQFHPEVGHTTHGAQMLHNFLYRVCGFEGDWTPGRFVEETVARLKAGIGPREKVILGLSGGVDSTVAAVLLTRAIGPRLLCVFVDNGLLRKNERAEVEEVMGRQMGLNLKVKDASEHFLRELTGVTDPEKKRKTIGRVFIEVFEQTAREHGPLDCLAQGTIYPDVIESVSLKGPSATIKSHHNVGGLPDRMNLRILEPLRELFKDEVRAVGRELGIPEAILMRHPFPGPGLGVRILGEVTREQTLLLQEADAIYIQELRASGWYDRTAQAFAVLLPVRAVGVMGDERTYEQVVALRAVVTQDFMTADWAPLPHELLSRVSSRIINEVHGVNRVVYDVSSKPPATIEWE